MEHLSLFSPARGEAGRGWHPWSPGEPALGACTGLGSKPTLPCPAEGWCPEFLSFLYPAILLSQIGNTESPKEFLNKEGLILQVPIPVVGTQ